MTYNTLFKSETLINYLNVKVQAHNNITTLLYTFEFIVMDSDKLKE
jgi:hypothetical protein